jgi:hypothetical protein
MGKPDRETIRGILQDFRDAYPMPLTRREGEILPFKHVALSVVGARRSGKTYRTYQCIDDFIAGGADLQHVCRIQFHDHRLSGLAASDLSIIDDTHRSMNPRSSNGAPTLFIFDEIHRIEGWEDYVLSLLDNPLNRVVITGSTSKLLRGDIAGGLRGKNLSSELLPFSFREFLRHHGIEPEATSSKGRAAVVGAFDRYLTQGGFPGLLDQHPRLHLDILQNYWDTMVLKDIIEAHPEERINISTFNHFALGLISRVGRPLSISRLNTDLREAGLSFSTDTLYRFFDYLQDAFMVFPVAFHSPSPRVRNRNYVKVYAVDWALADAITPGGGIDESRRLENLVYLHLRRLGHLVSYYRTRKGHKIDFVALPAKPRASKGTLVQVCLRIDAPDTLERELRGIPETMRFLDLDAALVITRDHEETIIADGVSVRVIPAWKWMLEA